MQAMHTYPDATELVAGAAAGALPPAAGFADAATCAEETRLDEMYLDAGEGSDVLGGPAAPLVVGVAPMLLSNLHHGRSGSDFKKRQLEMMCHISSKSTVQ